MPKKHRDPEQDLALQSRIGAAVKTYRHQLGITQEELAWRADMHRTYIADIERGARNVTLRSITNLARALQLTVENLLHHSADQTSPTGTDPNKPEARSLGEVIMVEDNPNDAELTQRALRLANFSNPIRVFVTGEDALEYLFREGPYVALKTDSPQLVLLDLKLPGKSGLEVLKMLKEHPRTKAIPIVVLTSSKHDDNIIKCGILGAENYLIKPISPETFNLVSRQMNLHWALVKPFQRPAQS